MATVVNVNTGTSQAMHCYHCYGTANQKSNIVDALACMRRCYLGDCLRPRSLRVELPPLFTLR
jgi:hypothetical protein